MARPLSDIDIIYATSQDRQPVTCRSLYGTMDDGTLRPQPSKDAVAEALRKQALAPIGDVQLFLAALDAESKHTGSKGVETSPLE